MSFRADAGAAVDLLALHRLNSQRYPFLLESVSRHSFAGRYDVLFAFPREQLVLQRGMVTAAACSMTPGEDFFDAAARLLRPAGANEEAEAELPFNGGWFVFLGYEAASVIEPRLRLPPSPFALPDALAVRCPAAVVVDRENNRTTLVAETDTQMVAAMQRDLVAAAMLPRPVQLQPTQVEEDDPAQFTAGVRRILEYLRSGDAFQVNLSRAWRARFEVAPEPASLYQALRQANPAPFAGLMRWGGSSVLSSSPERLVAVNGDVVETRPIAGTCARLEDVDADAEACTRFVANLKERAEHVMLIDLERNDLGRVCRPGSIEVDELMTLESYAHVHHLVSSVRGRLRDGIGPGEVMRALFPGGTITGCPKVRAMELIAELEGTGRGPYTGAMGYVSRCGRMDLNILIRSLVLEGDRATLRAGAGIVADSCPDAELAETRHKARGLLRALGAAV